MLNKIQLRSKINDIDSVSNFADRVGVRRAALYNFLNDKCDLHLSSFLKIIEPLDVEIQEKIPQKIYEVGSVLIDGKSYKKGDKLNGSEVILCFASEGTSHQFAVLNNGIELLLFNC